ncbi:MAG TPA: hypothetical protein VLV49_17165 [Terriglobales bacterium]|nr:hypothetical protein [Terriglobales bacterium]
MSKKQEYDAHMRWLSAPVAAFALVAALMAYDPPAQAQIHGTPASVTSINFGGHYNPGVRASLTSLGPQGYTPHGQFFRTPNCCMNPLFPLNPNPPRIGHHRPYSYGYGYGGYGAAYPVAVPVYVLPYGEDVQQPEEQVVTSEPAEDEYRGGPTIFDRRGPGTPARAEEPQANDYASNSQPAAEPAPAPPPAENQPMTLLVFKDGRQLEVQNYAIVGSELYDLTPERRHKIALADLDLAATAKANDERGIDFELPANKD